MPRIRFPRWARLTLLWLAGLLATLVIVAGALWIYLHPTIERTNGIVYGQRNGRPLTLDILRPEKPNGLGIALMVSGGWKSQRAGGLDALLVAPVLRAGYNVFAVCHISQPESTIMDIIDDVHRGIRFIRHRAAEYRVDPKRLGVTGGSAVQAVAIFYPPTDLLNLGPSTENDGKGGPPLTFAKGFGPDAQVPALWQKIGHDSSPIYYVTPAMPPVLIYHGDADTLVPLEQSQRFQARAKEVGLNVPVIVHAGGGHGWPSMIFDEWAFVDWFNRHLKP